MPRHASSVRSLRFSLEASVPDSGLSFTASASSTVILSWLHFAEAYSSDLWNCSAASISVIIARDRLFHNASWLPAILSRGRQPEFDSQTADNGEVRSFPRTTTRSHGLLHEKQLMIR